jgi:hypothetical protein
LLYSPPSPPPAPKLLAVQARAHLNAATEARKTEPSYPPGARNAMDGHHDVADRPSKFLMVVYHA